MNFKKMQCRKALYRLTNSKNNEIAKGREEVAEVKIGTIIYLNQVKGYGFISPKGNQDRENNMFFHSNNLINAGFGQLKHEDEVEYIEINSRKGKRAIDIMVM